MSTSKKYLQLTPDILVEYNYNNTNELLNQVGDSRDHIKDLKGNACVVNSRYSSNKTFVWKDDENWLALPINKSESKFVKAVNKSGSTIWDQDKQNFKLAGPGGKIVQDDDYNTDILYDTFRLNFTSRNYLGNNNYDGFIISVNIYDKQKNKICLLSKCIKKNEDVNLHDTPILLNQKMYTTYFDFKIPNVSALIMIGDEDERTSIPSRFAEDELYNSLIQGNNKIMENTPVVLTIYGIKSTYIVNQTWEYYNVEKINSIYIPIIDKSNNISIIVKEADDGDYFEIYPEIDNGTVSFSDYLYNLSDGRPDVYIVFHELTLYEQSSNDTDGKKTHHEQHIVNATNEDELDDVMLYRPILVYPAYDTSFRIDVKTHIINTLDNTTSVIGGSCRYGQDIGENPKKYGKKMNKIYLGDIPAQVNVYNKKPDIDIDGVKITNSSSNVTIENHQHSIIGFIECANVGVSIEQIPSELLV